MSSTKWHSHLASLTVIIVAALLALAAIYYRQNIVDIVRALQYRPSSQMATIRKDLQLTSNGELLFNASEPEIEATADFNRNCQQQKETNNPILGCYINQSIFVYDVTNDKLAGIEETTAAHELLHAAYDRLRPSEKTGLDKELSAAYDRIKTPALEERMAYYKQSEPGQELNELHSILGTEFADLGPALEAHYAQYFADRRALLKYYDAYSSIFNATSDKLKQLQTDINTQTKAVNGDIKAYNAASARLKSDAETFNARASHGGFSTEAEFAAARSSILSRQDALTKQRHSIEAAIQAIDTKKASFNTLAEQYNQLNQSINSSLAPTPQL